MKKVFVLVIMFTLGLQCMSTHALPDWFSKQAKSWQRWGRNEGDPANPYESESYFPRLAVYDQSAQAGIIRGRIALAAIALPLTFIAGKKVYDWLGSLYSYLYSKPSL